MKFLYDFFPVLLFFVVYKFYGVIPPGVVNAFDSLPLLALTPGNAEHAIYLATAVAILASMLQVSLYYLRFRRFEKSHLISLAVITVFGGATLALHDPLFIKWKPTILNWLFAAAFLTSQFVGNKTLIERMMEHAVTVRAGIWRRVNLGWVSFFLIAGLANIYVAYNFSEETWVDFKLFGLMGMTLAFVFAQALYLSRYTEPAENETRQS
ncbi:MAG: septation protein A [Gammaproteobacteria bacterium]|nr:septation protein A [Gammaproteobacteria bacterium]